ncbi:MAG: hypothetical protein AAGD06_33485, partial [Acidobacteriota bacterium]
MACILPTDEITEFRGWAPIVGDLARFDMAVTPFGPDFTGRDIEEAADSVVDGCWFQGSAIERINNGNWIQGGMWRIIESNLFNLADEIGVEGTVGGREFDEYYVFRGRAPCQVRGRQAMGMNCSWEGHPIYTRHFVTMDVRSSGMAVTRDGVTTPTRN